MTVVADVLKVSQLGIEVTEGTGVAANRLMQGMSIDLMPKQVTKPITPHGFLWPTANPIVQDWTDVSINGILLYNEIDFLLANAVKNAPTTTTPATGTNTRKRVYVPSSTAVNAADSWTVEQGQTGFAYKATGVRLGGYGFKFSRDADQTLTGAGIARLFTSGITMTASPTTPVLAPMRSTEMNVYVDSTAANLGVTQLADHFESDVTVASLIGSKWTSDRAQTSYTSTVITKPTGSVKMTVEANATGLAFLAGIRAGTRKFVRYEFLGPVTEAALTYLFYADYALEAKSSTFGNKNGVSTITWDFDIMHDATWGQAVGYTTQSLLSTF